MKTTAHPPTLAALLGLALTFMGAPAATYFSDPVAGTAAGDGSANAPWPKLQELASGGNLATLQGGDTLLLRSGNHGDVKLSGDNATVVTLAAAPGQTPQLSRLVITRGANWLVKGLTISPSFAPAPYAGNIVTVAEGGPSRDLVLEDCFIYTALDSTKWTAADWIKTHNGVFMGRHGTHLTLRNNYILNTRFAVSLCAPDSLCEGNIITNFSGDGIRITRDSLTVQFNTVKNCFVGPADGDDNHDDLMQCFLFNKGTGTIRNAIIRGNILIGFEDSNQPLKHEPQAIGFFDGPLVDFLVEKNVIRTNHYHGISLYDAVNCKILDNVVKPISDQKMKPWIMLGTKKVGGSTGNEVKNNMATSFNLKADPKVVAADNIPVDDSKFDHRLKELEREINAKFGEFHPVAKLSRLGMRTAGESTKH
jgi:parallel beta-helix repeat protein